MNDRFWRAKRSFAQMPMLSIVMVSLTGAAAQR
jgi:hypothetical protein